MNLLGLKKLPDAFSKMGKSNFIRIFVALKCYIDMGS